MNFEIEIIKSLQTISSPVFDGFCKAISHIANYIGFIFVFGLFFILYNKRFSIYFAFTYGLSILTNFLLKFIINRPRPYLFNSEVLNILPGSGAAMPSGHTLSATIISCFCLFVLFKKLKSNWTKAAVLVLFAGFISFVIVSRMYLGQHYLTDTLVGFAEGIIFSLIGIFAYLKFSKKEEENGNKNS